MHTWVVLCGVGVCLLGADKPADDEGNRKAHSRALASVMSTGCLHHQACVLRRLLNTVIMCENNALVLRVKGSGGGTESYRGSREMEGRKG